MALPRNPYILVLALIEATGPIGLHQLMAITVSVIACAFDLRTRRIPNLLTLGGALGATAFAAFSGPNAAGVSVLGWSAGLALYLPFYLLGGLGAGDVKLLACLGAWLGPATALWVALYGALAGGLMAVVMACTSGHMRVAMSNLFELLHFFRVAGVRPHPHLTLEKSTGPRLPYALPIAAGVLAAIWLH